jgi:hypothetical protein
MNNATRAAAQLSFGDTVAATDATVIDLMPHLEARQRLEKVIDGLWVVVEDEPLPSALGAASTDDGRRAARDPKVEQAFVKLTADISAAVGDYDIMLAVRKCAETLEPLGDAAAIDELREMGDVIGIGVAAMTGMIEQGLELARKARAWRNGGTQGGRRRRRRRRSATAMARCTR